MVRDEPGVGAGGAQRHSDYFMAKSLPMTRPMGVSLFDFVLPIVACDKALHSNCENRRLKQ